MREPYLNVEITSPTKKDIDKYYETTGDIKLVSSDKNSIILFQKAFIKETFDEQKYPVGSTWMMGESPGMKGCFFGEPILLIQEKDLYKRIK